MIFMPVVALDKEGAEDIIDGYMAHMKPMAYELVFSKDTPEIQRLIKKSVPVVPRFSSIHFGRNYAEGMMMTVPWSSNSRMKVGVG